MKQFIDTIVGKQAWPIDNSRQYNIKDGTSAILAGTRWNEPKMVVIISEPYKLKYIFLDKEFENEFVTVMCEGEVYTCLNNFYFSYEEAHEAHLRFLSSCEEINYRF